MQNTDQLVIHLAYKGDFPEFIQDKKERYLNTADLLYCAKYYILKE